MTTYQQQKQKVLKLAQAAITFANNRGEKEIAQKLKDTAQRLAEEKLLVVVAGEFKQGKSSLINAMINEKDLFPVDVDITTNLVSTITYGTKEKFTVFLGEKGKERAQQIQRKDVPEYVTEQLNQGNSKQARMLSIEAPNPQLKEGLILVDTPGVGGLNIQHTDITYAFIPNADAILFVSDALTPLANKELDFIKMILQHCQNLIFIVTKIDTVRNYRTIIENNREKLEHILQRPGDTISIIPVSSNAKLAYLQSKDEEDLEDSNFAQLESELWQLLSQQRGQILLGRTIGELVRSLAQLKLPLQAEWETYQQNSKQELDTLESQFQEIKDRLQSLLEDNAQWQTQLNYGISDIRRQVLGSSFEKGSRQIRTQAQKYIDDPRLLVNPQQIANLISTDINALVTNLGREMLSNAEKLQAEIEKASKLNLNPFEVSSLNTNIASAPDLSQAGQQKQQHWWDKTVDVGRRSSFNAGGATFLAGVIGSVLGGAIGTMILPGIGTMEGITMGSAIGAGLVSVVAVPLAIKKGTQESTEAERNAIKQEILAIIKPFMDESLSNCRETLERGLIELERFMQRELKAQIRQEKEAWERSLQSIQQARKSSQESIPQKIAALKEPLQEINALQKATEELARATLIFEESNKPLPPKISNNQPKNPRKTTSDYGDWADADEKSDLRGLSEWLNS